MPKYKKKAKIKVTPKNRCFS